MAELWGAIERALGAALSFIYDLIPNYGIAIILLTVATRVVLIPLTIKMIRSQSAMTELQPKLKEIQAKYKQDRQKLNEEMMKLYKEHNVNPFGSCLPLLAQMPVFIALFSILRAFITVDVAVAFPETGSAPIAASTYSEEEIGRVVCRPDPSNGRTTVNGEPGLKIECIDGNDEVKTFRVAGFSVPNTDEEFQNLPDLIATCLPRFTEGNEAISFVCRSALGTGHLPRDGDLFEDINADEASFLGMRLGCTATQVGDKVTGRQCTASEEAAGDLADQIPYYILIALIVGTSYYQTKQMASRAKGQAAQQQKIMVRVLPIFFGFISLSLPAGTNIYFLATNVWTIGQQAIVLKKKEQAEGGGQPKPKKKLKAPPGSETTVVQAEPPSSGRGQTPKKGRPTPKRKKKRR